MYPLYENETENSLGILWISFLTLEMINVYAATEGFCNRHIQLCQYIYVGTSMEDRTPPVGAMIGLVIVSTFNG